MPAGANTCEGQQSVAHFNFHAAGGVGGGAGEPRCVETLRDLTVAAHGDHSTATLGQLLVDNDAHGLVQ